MFVVGGIGIQVDVTPENSVVAKGYNMSFTIEMTNVRALTSANIPVPTYFWKRWEDDLI